MASEFSEKSQNLQDKLSAFMSNHVYPNELEYTAQLHAAENRFATITLIEELKVLAREAGLWNLFVPEPHGQHSDYGGLRIVDYASPAETIGRGIDLFSNWQFYLAFRFFRFAAVLQGVMKRVLDGNASSKRAVECGCFAADYANMGMALCERSKDSAWSTT